ncbi:nuclear transport factor 2 family protein [Streptomyces sp. Edi4]|uniref:nuclear transport factor 2 family protein n=1 Tax=Streptomyces sp. Edi4 TaxID=3162527 RepID=UPI0033065709
MSGERTATRDAADRAELRELFDRYVVALDSVAERDLDDDWFRTVFTEDVELSFPIGSHHGVAGYAAFQRTARAWWRATHHISGPHAVDVDGDGARLRVHQLATHVHLDADAGLFEVGGHYEAHALRTADGWRLARIVFHVDWTRGRRLAAFADAPF